MHFIPLIILHVFWEVVRCMTSFSLNFPHLIHSAGLPQGGVASTDLHPVLASWAHSEDPAGACVSCPPRAHSRRRAQLQPSGCAGSASRPGLSGWTAWIRVCAEGAWLTSAPALETATRGELFFIFPPFFSLFILFLFRWFMFLCGVASVLVVCGCPWLPPPLMKAQCPSCSHCPCLCWCQCQPVWVAAL